MRCPCGSRICLQLSSLRFCSIFQNFLYFVQCHDVDRAANASPSASHHRMFARLKQSKLGTTLCKFSQKYHFLRTFILTAASFVHLENKRRKLIGFDSHFVPFIVVGGLCLAGWRPGIVELTTQFVFGNEFGATVVKLRRYSGAYWLGIGTIKKSINKDMTSLFRSCLEWNNCSGFYDHMPRHLKLRLLS